MYKLEVNKYVLYVNGKFVLSQYRNNLNEVPASRESNKRKKVLCSDFNYIS